MTGEGEHSGGDLPHPALARRGEGGEQGADGGWGVRRTAFPHGRPGDDGHAICRQWKNGTIRLLHPQAHGHEGLRWQAGNAASRHLDGAREGGDVLTGEGARQGQPLRAAIRAGVAETGRVEKGGQRRRRRLADAPDLKIRPRGQVEMTVAVAARALRHRSGLGERQDAHRRVDAREQSVAGRHGPPETRAPAPAGAIGQGARTHSAASPIIASAGRALRRLVQRPRSRASSNRSRIARVAAGLAARRRSNTSGSAIQAE